MKVKQYRHGDILCESIDKLPEGTKVKKDNIILSASHDHILEGEAKIYTLGEEIYLKVTGKANLNHEEHRKIKLPVGIYQVIRQVEFTPYDGLINVED
jgi:hypothetical protein